MTRRTPRSTCTWPINIMILSTVSFTRCQAHQRIDQLEGTSKTLRFWSLGSVGPVHGQDACWMSELYGGMFFYFFFFFFFFLPEALPHRELDNTMDDSRFSHLDSTAPFLA